MKPEHEIADLLFEWNLDAIVPAENRVDQGPAQAKSIGEPNEQEQGEEEGQGEQLGGRDAVGLGEFEHCVFKSIRLGGVWAAPARRSVQGRCSVAAKSVRITRLTVRVSIVLVQSFRAALATVWAKIDAEVCRPTIVRCVVAGRN